MTPLNLSGLERSIDAACAEIDRLRAVNAELLAALKAVTRTLEPMLLEWSSDPDPVIVAAEAAIAKAEAQP